MKEKKKHLKVKIGLLHAIFEKNVCSLNYFSEVIQYFLKVSQMIRKKKLFKSYYEEIITLLGKVLIN